MSRPVVKTIGHEGPAPVRRAAGRRALLPTSQQAWSASRAQRVELAYRAAQPSRYRHDVGGLGGTADAHYAWGLDYWRIRELVREYDRNDPILGQLCDRGLDNIIGTGLRVDPQTGDPGMDADLRAWWEAWADDPAACDWSGRYTIDEMERLALRHAWVDGDCFAILDERSGMVRLEEGDRCLSYQNASDDVVHGVILDGSGKPRAYLFQVLRPGERKRHQFGLPSFSDLVEIPAEHVIHVAFPRRATQTRGISAFAPVVDLISLVGDIEHARLVKLQVSSCIAGFLYSDYPATFGFGGADSEESALDDATNLEFGELTPGMLGRLARGSKFEGFAPHVASADEGAFVEAVIRRVGLAIGLPIEISLLTTKDTSFSGFRGVVEQYKITARVVQAQFKRRFRSRLYRWHVRRGVEAGLFPDRAETYRHNVLVPTWPYIDPETDARADALRIERRLASPRQVWAERGRDYDQGVVEIAEDAAAAVKQLAAKADELTKSGVPVTWQDLAQLGAPRSGAAGGAPPGGMNPGQGTKAA